MVAGARRRISGASWHASPTSAPPGARVRCSRIRSCMPGARFFPAARLNFAANLLRYDDDRDSAGVPQRARRAPHALLPRAARRSGARRRGPGGRRAWWPATAWPASCPTCRKLRSRCSPPPASGRSGPRARRISACTACSTASGRSRPRCCSPPTAISTPARNSTRSQPMAEVLAKLDSVAHVVVVPYVEAQPQLGALGAAAARATLWQEFGTPGAALACRRPALQSSAVHPLFLRHDRCAQVHRARRRAAHCCSTGRSTCCTPTSGAATGCSTSPPAAG